MSAEPAGFQFTNERPRASTGSLVVRVPAKLNRKRRLLAEFAGQLRFPDYFGWNWDAWVECLRDLSWLDGVRQVTIVHRDVPFADAAESRQTYLSILRDRVQSIDGSPPSVSVIFPACCCAAVVKALEQADRDSGD